MSRSLCRFELCFLFLIMENKTGKLTANVGYTATELFFKCDRFLPDVLNSKQFCPLYKTKN